MRQNATKNSTLVKQSKSYGEAGIPSLKRSENSENIYQVSRTTGGVLGEDDAALTLPPAPKSKTSCVSNDENPVTSPESKQEPVPPTNYEFAGRGVKPAVKGLYGNKKMFKKE